MDKFNAYFDNMADANKALKALQQAGYSNAHLDLAGIWDYEYSKEIGSPDMNHIESGGAGTEDENDHQAMYSVWSRYLNSGMSHSARSGAHFGQDEHDVRIGTRLVLKAPVHSKENIEKIINEHGGRILSSFMEL